MYMIDILNFTIFTTNSLRTAETNTSGSWRMLLVCCISATCQNSEAPIKHHPEADYKWFSILPSWYLVSTKALNMHGRPPLGYPNSHWFPDSVLSLTQYQNDGTKSWHGLKFKLFLRWSLLILAGSSLDSRYLIDKGRPYPKYPTWVFCGVWNAV